MRERDFTTLETERLTVRRFDTSDIDAFAAYRADPEVARYQSWEGYTREDAERFIAEMGRADPGVPGEWFQFAIEERASGRLAGDCALVLDTADPPTAQIGYTLDPAFTGRGYATEAAAALIGYTFERLGVARVHAIADTRNHPSIAVAERLGMHRIATVRTTIKGEPCEEHTYEMTHERRAP